jgi:hypothetical protein
MKRIFGFVVAAQQEQARDENSRVRNSFMMVMPVNVRKGRSCSYFLKAQPHIHF